MKIWHNNLIESDALPFRCAPGQGAAHVGVEPVGKVEMPVVMLDFIDLIARGLEY